ncbi:hypothetical protein [Sphingobium sp. AP50]|uniref:hypothetical protein n=1 Tax=Sphingobium sp. AP50 TaxID=1884369 RepID=UPI0015A53FA5|nr:hypothetical protein [Sphingobium sp. AP50]
MIDDVKNIGDALSLTVTVATVGQFLPHLAAVLSIVWTLIRLTEWFVEKWQSRSKS